MGLFSNGGGCGDGRGGCPRRASREKCPRCGLASVVVQDDYLVPSPAGRFLGLAGINMMPISIYRCEDCGHIWGHLRVGHTRHGMPSAGLTRRRAGAPGTAVGRDAS